MNKNRVNPVYGMPKPWQPEKQSISPGNDITHQEAKRCEAIALRPDQMPADQPQATYGGKVRPNHFICREGYPMPVNIPKGSRWEHVDAAEVDGTSDEYAYYECPNCGHRFKSELPQ
jgi:hypothetical protein